MSGYFLNPLVRLWNFLGTRFQFISTISTRLFLFCQLQRSFSFYRVPFTTIHWWLRVNDWNFAHWEAAICSPSFEPHGSWSVYKSLIYAARDILVINRATIIHVSNGTISSRGRYPRISRTFQSSFSPSFFRPFTDTWRHAWSIVRARYCVSPSSRSIHV